MRYPTFAFPGGKARISEWIISHFPRKGNRYGEPFVGMGNIFWRAALNVLFKEWYINDLRTAPFYSALFQYADDDFPERMTPKIYNELKTEKSSISTLLEPIISPLGGGYQKGGFYSLDGSKREGYFKYKVLERLDTARNILSSRNPTILGNQWYTLDWFELWTEDDFIYLDPPYYESFTGSTYNNIDHYRLLQTLKSCKCKWILSGYTNPLYLRQIGKPFAEIERRAEMSSVNHKNETRTENLWKNF